MGLTSKTLSTAEHFKDRLIQQLEHPLGSMASAGVELEGNKSNCRAMFRCSCLLPLSIKQFFLRLLKHYSEESVLFFSGKCDPFFEDVHV